MIKDYLLIQYKKNLRRNYWNSKDMKIMAWSRIIE